MHSNHWESPTYMVSIEDVENGTLLDLRRRMWILVHSPKLLLCVSGRRLRAENPPMECVP
jgi:hypothetical protein